MAKAASRIVELAELLKKYKDAYYNAEPLVSDAAYDALEDELRALDPAHPILRRVGAPDVTEWEKLESGLPSAGIFLVSRKAWEQVGGFRAGFKAENIDYDFHRRVRKAGLRAYLLKEVYLFHSKGL